MLCVTNAQAGVEGFLLGNSKTRALCLTAEHVLSGYADVMEERAQADTGVCVCVDVYALARRSAEFQSSFH